MPGREDFIKILEKNIVDYKNNPTEEIVNSIYEAIITLRVNGALSFVIRDLSAEDLIRCLNELKQKDSALQTMHAEIIRLTAEIQKYITVEQPAKVDLPAAK